LGIVGLLASIGGILSGSFSDRFGREITLTLGSGLAFVGIFILILVRDNASPWMLYAFVILYGLGQGTLPSMGATATADLFPGNSLGRIFSIQTIGFGLGSGLGAYVGGFFYYLMGSYVVPFYLLLVSLALAVLGIWMAAPRHQKDLSLFDQRL
jgi:MFS family permease